jgi:peroxiredoxin
MPRAKPSRKTILLAATACAAVLAAVLAVTGFSSGSANGASYIDSKTILYPAGHRHAAPDFSGRTLTGSLVAFRDYRGKVLVLNFWGSWCVPCRTEATTLTVIADQYRRAGVEFLGVDLQDNTPGALAFTQSHGISYPSLSDPNDLVPLAYGSIVPMAATPTTLVIDSTGHIAGAVFGETSYAELTKLLHKVMAK